jgi:hypothetical protein
MPYFDDDGNEINPDFYPKPGLCLICKKNNDKDEEILCTLNRIDQRMEHEFKCGAFEEITPNP